MARPDVLPGMRISQASLKFPPFHHHFCRFIHLAVALAALAVLLGNRAYILQNSFLLLGYCLPLMGLIFLLASFAIVSLHLGYQVEQLVSSFCVVSLSLLMPVSDVLAALV